MAARRSNVLTLFVSVLMACGLWTYVTLTRTYEDDIDVPIAVMPPAGQNIISAVPATITVRVRTTGLRIANFRIFNQPDTCTLALEEQSPTDPSAFQIGTGALLSTIAGALGVRVVSVSPVDITVRTGTPVIKSVPLTVAHSISCRPGFIMTTAPTPDRASATLKGVNDVVAPLTHWTTKRIMLDDVHESTTIEVPMSDSLASMVDVMPKSVRVRITVQQLAEIDVHDVPITLSQRLIDAGFVARPARIRVTLRGGVDDLASITSADLRAEITDANSYGIVLPTVTAPGGMRVISLMPRTVQLVRRQPL
ncbi:MAG: hypothetical protein ACKOE4_03905 [Candidatus Kapaibacterium sp.]